MVKCQSQCVQLQMLEVLCYILKKKKKHKNSFENVSGSLLFKDHPIKWTQTPQNIPSRERPNMFF